MHTNVNYTEHILYDVLTHGLAGSEIQLDLFGDKNLDMNIEEVLQFLGAKESGRQSAGHVLQAQGADAACSQYRSAKNTELKNRQPNNLNSDPCHNCSKHGHGRNSPTRVRKLECPAYGKHCDHCGCAKHFVATQAKSQPGKQWPTPPNATTAEAEVQCSMPCPRSTILTNIKVLVLSPLATTCIMTSMIAVFEKCHNHSR